MTQTTSNTPKFAPQISVPATYMRGGTSKGTFFKLSDDLSVAKLQARREITSYYVLSAAQILTASKSMVSAMAALALQRR